MLVTIACWLAGWLAVLISSHWRCYLGQPERAREETASLDEGVADTENMQGDPLARVVRWLPKPRPPPAFPLPPEDPPLPSRQAGGRASGTAAAAAILWRCSVGGAGLVSRTGPQVKN